MKLFDIIDTDAMGIVFTLDKEEKPRSCDLAIERNVNLDLSS